MSNPCPALAHSATEKRTSFTEFLEELLVAKRNRAACERMKYSRGWRVCPAIKILDQCDFGVATGGPRKQITKI